VKVESSPTISLDGIVYCGSNDDYLHAIYGSGTIADSPWQKFRHDLKNTGQVLGAE
jgi:hypothetical protein